MNDVQQIALGYAPKAGRDALAALWDYDAALGRVVATTTEPMIGQMRLTWWHEQMTGLDKGEVPAEPIIASLQDVIRNHDVTGAMLAELVEGWEALLEPLPLGDDALREFAAKRGDGLFDLSATVMGGAVSAGLGEGWALIDFATHCSDRSTAELAWSLARAHFSKIPFKGPKPLRILAQLATAKATQPFDQIMVPVSRWAMLRAVLS